MDAEQLNKLRKALETGRDAAQEVAERCHQEFAGYKEHRHKAVDADVAEIEAALELIALAEKAAERAVSPAESVQSNTLLMQEAENTINALRQRAEAAEAALARQAPDLSKLTRYGLHCSETVGYYIAACIDGDYWKLADVQALLSSTAQPLQQPVGTMGIFTGAHDVAWEHGCIPAVGTKLYTAPQPLQQEGGKVEAYQQGRAAGLEEAAKVCENQCDPTRSATTSAYAFWHAKAIRALAQPSDNLQQASTEQVSAAITRIIERRLGNKDPASTAQAEPAKKATSPCSKCNGEGGHEIEYSSTSGGWLPCENCKGEGRVPVEGGYRGDGLLQPPDPPSFERCEDCEGTGKEAPSATDAGQEPIEDPVTVPRGLIGAACYLIRKHAPESELLGKLREFTTGARSGYRTTPAQATPEGGDAERSAFMRAMCTLDFSVELDEEGLFRSESTNAMWVGWRERAALMPATAAEPVAWMYHTLASDEWRVTTNQVWANALGTPVVPLYRAAPRQQIDESGLPG